MKALSLNVAKIEPYSYSSAVLEDYKRELDYYSMVYDFLAEYANGDEEMDSAKLLSITRLVNSPSMERKYTDTLSTSYYKPEKLVPGYQIFLDKALLDSNTILIPGTTVTVTAQYTPARPLSGSKSLSISPGGVLYTSSGFKAVAQNLIVPLADGGINYSLTVQAYLNGVPIAPLQAPIIIPVRYTIDDVFYYGATVPAATEAQIRALTRLLEPKGNKTLEFTSSGQILYFAYPQSYGALTSIVDQNGFDITTSFTLRPGVMFNLTSPNYGSGVSAFNVYEYNNPTTVTRFNITFNF